MRALRITAAIDGFRRAGVGFGKEAVTLPADQFTEGQIEQLKSEPLLTVVEFEHDFSDAVLPAGDGGVSDQVNDLIERYQGDIDTLKLELDHLLDVKLSLQADLSSLQSALSASQSEVSRLTSERAAISEIVEGQKVTIDGLRDQLTAAQESNAQLVEQRRAALAATESPAEADKAKTGAKK